MSFEVADRLKALPPYLFAEIDKKKKAAMAAGRDVINLGIGDPDKPTPVHIIEALKVAAEDPANHQYALDNGYGELREAFAKWFKNRFDVSLEADGEIYPTIGSKEAIAHLPLAFVNPGDVVLVPTPAYPVYRSGTIFCGGRVVEMPLLKENAFLPDFSKISDADAAAAKIMWLNYPNNPTAACATKEFFVEAVAFCKKHNIVLAHDMAYSEMYYSDTPPLSILEIEGAKDVAIELHSLSKTFNMTGWRIGFVVGNADLVAGLSRVKGNCDSGIFGAVQMAGIAALEGDDAIVKELRDMYRGRRDAFCAGLNEAGWKVDAPEASFYVWVQVPLGWASTDVAARLLDEADIVMTPGNGFGGPGEGFIRATLTVDVPRLLEAVERIKKLDWTK